MNSVSDTQVIEPKTEVLNDMPHWIKKLILRQDQLNRRYEKAHSKFAGAYNDFLSAMDEINAQFGTSFTIEQALAEFQGVETIADLEDDDDE